MNPDFPIYIPTKGRWKSRTTARILDRMRVPYRIVVEEQEHAEYARYIDPSMILTLPPRYKAEYDTCDDLGEAKGKGPGAARNFAWDHAISEGHAWHWVMDDNIEQFYRMNRNKRLVTDSGSIFKAAEDFVQRYENIAISGLNYHTFARKTDAIPPYDLNTRIYSCLLIRNDIPYRWRGRYNEDTDICLRVLKDGWVTLQFNAFLAGKVTTQRMSGGNTEEFYRQEGTLAKSQMLADLHPDVAKVVWRFNRWHHLVDYSPFTNNRLIRKQGLEIPDGVDEYGMVLKPYLDAPALVEIAKRASIK
jgi:hypothetical protein